MCRFVRWVGLVVFAAASGLGCSSTAPPEARCQGGDCLGAQQLSQTGNGGAAGNSAAVPASDGAFGNATGLSAPPMADPKPDDAMAPPGTSASGGACKEGELCVDTGPDPDNCGTLRFDSDVEVTVQPGNLLIIFDDSASMGEPWPGTGGDKRLAARTALEAAVGSLQDQLTVGAIFFPTYACVPAFPPPPGGAVAPITDPTQIAFTPGPQFLQTWNARWQTAAIGGIGTPMNEAFDRADQAIQAATLNGKLAVVAFTDGEPNCLPDATVSGAPTMPEPDRAASWLSNLDIKTYVVGLPGAAGVQVLNSVAQSGGTMNYIVPDDPAQLEEKLREVVEETVSRGFNSCSISLKPPAEVPDELLMLVTEPGAGLQNVPRDRGWSLAPDGVQVEITGKLCEDAMNGRFESITFEYACPTAPPPPPLPPLE